MSGAAEVRLVRCPKCGNLLPEVTEFSVYQCGGCSAVLRADNKRVVLETFSEKSYEDRVGMMKGRLPAKYDRVDRSEKRMMGMNDGYESDRMSKISSSSRAEARVFTERAENYMHNLMNREEMWDDGGNVGRGMTSDGLRRAKVAQEFGNLTLYDENEERWERSSGVVNGRNGERYLRPRRVDAEDMRYTNSIFSEESGRIGDDMSEPSMKFDGNLVGKGKEKALLQMGMAHHDSYSGLENRYPESYMGMNSRYPDPRFNRPSSRDNYFENPSLTHRHELAGNGFHHPLYPSSQVQEYEDPLGPQMVMRRGHFQTPVSGLNSRSHPYVSGSYKDDVMVYLDQMEPYHPNANRPHPSCSCFQCCNPKHVPPPVQPAFFSDKFSDAWGDSRYNYQENQVSFDPRYYNSRPPAPDAPPPRSHYPQPDTSWHGDANSDIDGFIRRRPTRVQFSSVGIHCCPIAGGSPFILCYNCFELLLLPRSFLTKSRSRRKIKCGACSTVAIFMFSDKKLVCIDAEATDATVKVDDNDNKSSIRGELYGRDHINHDRESLSSADYDNIGCDFQSMDREPEYVRGRVNDSSETKHRYSMSTHTTDLEEDTESNTESEMESENVPRENSTVVEQKAVEKESRPPVGSSLQEHFEYSNKFHAVNRQAERDTSGNSKHKKHFPRNSIASQISINDLASATETDVSSNDFTNTGTSLDSGYVSRKGRKAPSFFAGIMKRSIKEINKSNQNVAQEKANVTVNGHPIPDEMINKVERVAGPISPGNYWYDYEAGFWGAVGGLCLGMIPPHIEEFNYPMPEKCAGGNTDVFVNGRELNQKDMNLLKRRGLPADRNRSYSVEISGRIIDIDTGEELKSLGKLAPSIERIQRGFGMRVPKAAA